jgi:flavodoxin
MAFTPLKLLLVYDNARRFCGRVAPDLKKALEDRAFEVESFPLDSIPQDLEVEAYDGLVLGIPIFGSGRDGGPSEAMTSFAKGLGDLDDHRVALFCVYQVWEGPSLLRFKAILEEQGAEVLCSQGFWVLRPQYRKHELPAEIMVRIR